jgi:hypothetical protein
MIAPLNSPRAVGEAMTSQMLEAPADPRPMVTREGLPQVADPLDRWRAKARPEG